MCRVPSVPCAGGGIWKSTADPDRRGLDWTGCYLNFDISPSWRLETGAVRHRTAPTTGHLRPADPNTGDWGGTGGDWGTGDWGAGSYLETWRAALSVSCVAVPGGELVRSLL